MANLQNLTLLEGTVLKRGLQHVLDNSKSDDEFKVATVLNAQLTLGASNGRYRLDKALDLQSEKLFAAEAIIKAVSDSIDDRYADDLTKAGTETPNYPRALAEAVKLLRDCYAHMETPTLEDLAEQLEKEEREEAEEVSHA